jgi:hypothetical protein
MSGADGGAYSLTIVISLHHLRRRARWRDQSPEGAPNRDFSALFPDLRRVYDLGRPSCADSRRLPPFTRRFSLH